MRGGWRGGAQGAPYASAAAASAPCGPRVGVGAAQGRGPEAGAAEVLFQGTQEQWTTESHKKPHQGERVAGGHSGVPELGARAPHLQRRIGRVVCACGRGGRGRAGRGQAVSAAQEGGWCQRGCTRGQARAGRGWAQGAAQHGLPPGKPASSWHVAAQLPLHGAVRRGLAAGACKQAADAPLLCTPSSVVWRTCTAFSLVMPAEK